MSAPGHPEGEYRNAQHEGIRVSALGHYWHSALVVVLCGLVGVHFALNLQQNGKTFLDADAYVHLHEKRPYQYRVLMAPVLGGLIGLLSQPALQSVTRRLPSYVAAAEPAAYFTINAVAFALSCWLVRAIARRSFAGRPAARTALAVYIAMAYLFFCLNPNVAFILPYDTAALVLSQACLLCILSGRWRWLYGLFALATVNRETSSLLILFVAAKAAFDRPPGAPRWLHDGQMWRRLLTLSAIWVAIKLVLYLRFAGLPSDEGLRLQYNLLTLLKPWQWPAILPAVAAFGLSLQALVRVPAGREWPLVGCVGFLMLCAVGQLIETRVFGDLIVYFAFAIVRGTTGAHLAAAADPSGEIAWR